MSPSPLPRSARLLLASALALMAPHMARADQPRPASGLHILVIEGEAAVNIIQQKTAVAPVVEVRDRNDQPVAGAVVQFAIKGGRATFSGARTLTVATNAAGRAAAAGLTPTANGALQISASAAFQGQSAVAVIAQTNVMTATEAGTAAGAGGAGGGSGAAAGGSAAGAGGGGLSATTLALVGGAAAGGAVVVAKAVGGGGTKYSGNFSGLLVIAFTGGFVCNRTETQTGTLEMKLDVAGDGTVTGSAELKGMTSVAAVTAGCGTGGPNQIGTAGRVRPEGQTQVSSTAATLAFSHSESFNSAPSAIDPGGNANAYTATFTGALNDATVVGTLTLTETIAPLNPSLIPGGGGSGRGSATFAVTLR